MKLNKLFRNSAMVTALLASLCCITPVLAVLGGLSGIASIFSFLEPLRPYFIAFTIIILGYAFYNAYKPKKKDEIECDCLPAEASAKVGNDEENHSKEKFINSKGFLWLVAVLAVVFLCALCLIAPLRQSSCSKRAKSPVRRRVRETV